MAEPEVKKAKIDVPATQTMWVYMLLHLINLMVSYYIVYTLNIASETPDMQIPSVPCYPHEFMSIFTDISLSVIIITYY